MGAAEACGGGCGGVPVGGRVDDLVELDDVLVHRLLENADLAVNGARLHLVLDVGLLKVLDRHDGARELMHAHLDSAEGALHPEAIRSN